MLEHPPDAPEFDWWQVDGKQEQWRVGEPSVMCQRRPNPQEPRMADPIDDLGTVVKIQTKNAATAKPS